MIFCVHLFRPSRLVANVSLHEPHSVLLLMPTSFQVRAFLVVGRASLRLKNTAVVGAIDCALHSLRPPQLPSLAAGLLRLRSLRLQTIFDGYVLALRRHHSFVVVLARFTPLSTRHRLWRFALQRNLRLPFRLVRTGSCTPFSNRREPPSAANLPPDRGLMNARKFAGGTRYIIRQGQVCSRLLY